MNERKEERKKSEERAHGGRIERGRQREHGRGMMKVQEKRRRE